MNKKTSTIVLTSLMVMNQISDTTIIYANKSLQPENNQQQSDKQMKEVVYLTNGEGDLNSGDGTAESPYQNIRTALKQVADGGVIKLVGMVQYNKHDMDTETDSALPLLINKKVTFEGATNNSQTEGILSRAPIQLEADVTFKDMRIQLINSNELMPGVPSPAPTPADEGIFKSGRTIYTAGYTLTLDNVNTRIGTNAEQTTYRPFISGGTYKSYGKLGSKSIVNIKNVNEGATRCYMKSIATSM